MATDTQDRVCGLIAGYLGISAAEVGADVKLSELGLDSLGAYELIFQIEEEFKIVVPNEQAAKFASVRAICEGIDSLQQRQVEG